jgi:DNA polymerase-3 subunit epsilon
LLAQLDRYPDLENDMKSISNSSTRKKNVDFGWNDFYLIKMETKSFFGKHRGTKKVEAVLESELGILVDLKMLISLVY